MKRKLMSAPILAYPQFQGEPFILDTDFSADPGAIGGVLSQVQDRQERVIAYGAQQLLPREQSYALTKGELLAVIFFLQYYKYYLLHRPFILLTDNRALTWIRSLESPTGMILRWLEILASFDFTVKQRKGTLHGNSDSLPRAPHSALPSPEEAKILVSDEAAVVAALQTPPDSPRKRSKTIRRGMNISETFKSGRRSCLPRQRNNYCLLTRGGSLHSCLPCIKILPPVSGVFRPRKRESRASASGMYGNIRTLRKFSYFTKKFVHQMNRCLGK